MKQKETIRSLWTPTAGMLSGARRVAMLLLATLLLTMTAQTALAETVNVNYLDASGASQSHDATPVAGSSLGDYNSETWYVVNSDVELTSALGIEGNVHLILADNTTLSVNAYDYGIYMYDNSSLTIYSQSLGSDMGKLEINSEFPIRIDANSLTINGGDISVTTNNSGVYLAANGSMTINNGTVSLTGTYDCVYNDNGSLTITGGTVTITAQTPIYNVNNYTKTGGTVTLKDKSGNAYYKVLFDANGGSGVSVALVVSGGTVSKPEDPTRDGYVFVGWYNGANEYDFTAAVTTDLTLTAKWGKNIANCTATVPDQTLEGPNNLFENIFYKFDYVNTSDGRSYVTEMGIIVKDGDKTLTLGTDYVFGTVAGKTGNEASQVGDEYTVQIVGQGDYAGTTTATFKIKNPGGAWGNLTWSLASGTLTISGKGTMNTATTYNGYGFPWVNYRSQINFVVIVEGITSIADKAFGETHNQEKYENVTAITLPSTLTSIGANAFKGCVGATDVYCFADPANLTWEDAGDDFKPATDPKDKTKCHVADGSDWSGFSNVNVTFVDDLADVCIPYIDANGTTAYCTDYTKINTSNMPTTLDAGWYVVNDDVNYTGTITLNGDVNLILADGCTMNIGTIENPVSSCGIYGIDHSISIYAQSMGNSKGRLHVNALDNGISVKGINICGGEVMTVSVNVDGISTYNGNITIYNGHVTSEGVYGLIASGDITINGGQVSSTGSSNGGTAIYAINSNITINGGEVSANGGFAGIESEGNITINGGEVSVNGSEHGGLYAVGGNITLGWTSADDRIYASSYEGTLTIVADKVFTDGTDIYDDATPSATLAALTNKTLQPAVKITLPTGVTATGTGVINQTDETYAVSGTDVTIAAATGYIISNVNTTGADLTDNGDDTYTFTAGTTDVTVTATVLTYIVTQSNFFNYFDDNGCLLDNVNVPFNELIFQGEFSNSNNELVPYIFLDRSITITGDNAILNDMAFIIAANNVTLDKLTLVANSNLGNLIDIAGENAVISNSNITYVVDEAASVINVYSGANGAKILKNTIYFESTVEDYAVDEVTNAICVNSGVSIFDDEDPIEGLVIDGNKITAVIPAFLADVYENEYYVMGISAVNGVRINGAEDFKFTNNTLNVTTNWLYRTTPTLQGMYVASSSGLIDKNNISMIDEFTPAGKDVYLYAVELINDEDLTISNNNFNISTTGGKEEAGAANAIIAIASDFNVVDNNITTVSKGPNAGIYFPSRMGAPCEAVISGNLIKVTGLATAAHETGLVSGIEIETGCVEISGNTICTYNIGEYAEGNYIYGISYAQDGSTPEVEITDNTIITEGNYAISFLEVDDAVITDNTLCAHELYGDDAVEIKEGSGNTVENNLLGYVVPKTGESTYNIPADVSLFKVYDDGGQGWRYSAGCGGTLTLTAPEGCRLQLSGNIKTEKDVDYLTVYDGSDNQADILIDQVSSSDNGTETDIPTVISTGNVMTIYFYSNNSGSNKTEFDGLDLTVTVIDNVVTQDNFYTYFDANGELRDAITFDELIFKGDFSNSHDELVPFITIDRPITITSDKENTGDKAKLNDIGFVIAADNVTLDNLTLVANSDLEYLIYVIAADDVTLDNVSVTYNAPNYAEAKAIFADDADGFALTNSEIIFTGADPGENHYRALEVNNSNAAIIDNNTITATFPAVAVDWGKTGIDQDLVLAVGIQGGDDIEFTNNRVTVNTNGDIDSYPTIDAVMVHSAEDILIKGNDITHLDNTTEDGPRYYYSLDIYSTTGTVEANNINVNTIGTGTAGIDRAGTAYPIQLTGPFTVTVKDNSITAISKGPIAGIYATNWQGAADLTVENNTIDITGYATTSNYALVAGIEAEIDVLKASNNTITVANGADYDDADANQVIGVGIGTSWFYGDTSADIKDNNMTVDSKYAVYYTKAVDTNVTGNNLIAHELKGNDAVYIADGSGNTVENNVPATLFAAGSTNQWMTWCGTKELVTPENVTVYTVTGINNEDDNHSIILDDVTTTASIGTQTMKVIPAYTPVLIYRETVGNDALYGMLNAPGIVPGSGYDSATGIVTSSTTGCTFYGTTKDLSNIPTANYTADRTYVLHGERFLLCKDNAGIGANKCWLVLNAPNGARQLSISIGSDDNTTGMEDVRWQTEERSGDWYSIDGRKLNGQPTKKGLYIYKGKKVVIK